MPASGELSQQQHSCNKYYVQLTKSSLGDRKDTFVILLSSSSNWKYKIFSLLLYFSVDVCLRKLYHHILSVVSYISWESWVFVSTGTEQSIMCANDQVYYGLKAVFISLYITLITIIVQTYLTVLNIWHSCQVCSVQCVSKVKLFFFIICYAIYGAVCFSLPIFLEMIARICVLYLFIIIKSETWIISHCLELNHKTLASAVCLGSYEHVHWSSNLKTTIKQ